MKNVRNEVVVIMLLPLCSCSLQYVTGDANAEKNVPEFTFTDAQLNRFRDKKNTLTMKAGQLEQYTGGTEIYARNLTFTMFGSDGKPETEGSCTLMAADTDAEKYELFDGIRINNHPRHVILSADKLRWNGKTEQLTSGRNDLITIVKDNTTISGSGFSASAVSNTFEFTGTVTGSVDTDDAAQENTAAAADTPQKTADFPADTAPAPAAEERSFDEER